MSRFYPGLDGVTAAHEKHQCGSRLVALQVCPVDRFFMWFNCLARATPVSIPPVCGGSRLAGSGTGRDGASDLKKTTAYLAKES